jgi:hypothetical protein
LASLPALASLFRNSIILVDFIELRRSQGMSPEDAVVDAGAVRFRPMLLTAAAVVVGASVILFDPLTDRFGGCIVFTVLMVHRSWRRRHKNFDDERRASARIAEPPTTTRHNFL